MREHRQAPRKRVKEWARIVFDEGRRVHKCTILDISEGGARLCIGNLEAPALLYLYRKSTGCFHEAAVVNRSSQFIGVRFKGDPIDAASASGQALLSSVISLV